MLDYKSNIIIFVFIITKDYYNNVQNKNICLDYLNFVKFRNILQDLLKNSNLDKLTLQWNKIEIIDSNDFLRLVGVQEIALCKSGLLMLVIFNLKEQRNRRYIEMQYQNYSDRLKGIEEEMQTYNNNQFQ